MKFLRQSVLMFGLIAILSPSSVTGHPHVWIDARTELVFDNQNRISSVRQIWQFDSAFTAFATQGLDEDGDGKFSREELQPLAEVNVTSLMEFDYFTFLSVGDFVAVFSEPKEYFLEYSDELLTLHYTLPLESPILMDGQEAKLKVYDPTYFIDFEMLETDPFVLVSAHGSCSMTVERPKELQFDTLSALASIPATEREVPESLFEITSTLSNTAIVNCT